MIINLWNKFKVVKRMIQEKELRSRIGLRFNVNQ